MDLIINVEKDNLEDVANGLREVAKQIEQGMTSGQGFITWSLNIEEEKSN